MRNCIFILAIVISLSISSNSYATDLSLEDEITRIARARCASELKIGQDYETNVLANGNVEFMLLGEKGGALDGTFIYSKREWEEQQKVLAEHQEKRDRDHTSCVTGQVESLRGTYVGHTKDVENKPEKSSTRALGGVKWEKTISDVSMTLKKCSKIGNGVACDLTLISEKSDIEFYLAGRSYLWDQSGDRYRISHAKIANLEKSLSQNYMSSLRVDLIQGVLTAVRLEFDGVSTDAEYVSKLLCKVKISKHNSEYSFKNMKITAR